MRPRHTRIHLGTAIEIQLDRTRKLCPVCKTAALEQGNTLDPQSILRVSECPRFAFRSRLIIVRKVSSVIAFLAGATFAVPLQFSARESRHSLHDFAHTTPLQIERPGIVQSALSSMQQFVVGIVLANYQVAGSVMRLVFIEMMNDHSIWQRMT